ncbi:MAG: metallophosphoesterase [Oscillospiraceae bacterium]|nr:metallophosphoesterase [Oscillospiraceae bacterium]
MKRFQKVSAFLMALALIVGLLPAGGFPMRSAAAETNPAVGDGNTYLRAVYQASGANVDGVADNTYPLTVALSDSVMMGAAWDATYLYLSVNSAAELAELKLNATVITDKAVTAAAGEDPGYAEYRIALMDADVPSLDVGVNTLTVKLTETAEEQTLYLIFDNNSYTKHEITVSGNLASTVEDNAYAATFGGETAGNSYMTADGSSLTPSLNNTTVVELDIDIVSLNAGYALDASVGKNVRYVTMGVNIQVMDELVALNGTIPKEAFVFGFTKDKTTGKFYFQSAVSDGAGSFTSSDVLLSETVGGFYHVRVEYTYAPDANGEVSHDSVVSAKYYLNGKLIDEQSNVRVSCGTTQMAGSTKGVRLYTSKLDNNVTVSNISVSYDNPAALAALKAAYAAGRQGPDQAAATLVASQIANLPAVSQLALTDKATVEAARAAYDALTPAQKAYVEEATLNTLAAAEAKIASLFVQSRNDYLFADAVGGIVLDGQIESSYRMNIPFTPTTQMGAVWDLTNLYLAITGEDLGEMTAVAVDGKSLNAVKGAGGNEYAIPVGALDLQGDKAYTLTFTLGDLIWNGTLVLGTNDYATAVLSGSYGAVVDKTLDKRAVSLVSTDGLNGSNVTKYQLASISTFNYKLEGLPETATIFEFDVKVNQMPDNATFVGSSTSAARTFCRGGLGVTIRDQDPTTVANSTYLCEAFFVGLCKQNGDMKLVYWDNDAGSFVTADAGDAVNGQYHVRVEYIYPENVYSNDIAANFFVNGRLVATAESTKQSGGSKSSGAPLGVNIAAYNGAEDTTVDVVVSNVSISHAKGQAYVEKQLDTTEPDQTNIVLQLGADKSQMNFTWFSKDETVGVIKFAKESELVGGQLPDGAASVTATRTDSFKTGYVGNKVTITGLAADTVYYYQLINGEDVTELKSFKTGKDGKEFNFAFVGDPQIGRGYGSDDGSNSLVLDHLKEDDEHWDRTLNQLITAPQFAGTDFLMSAGDQTNTHLGEYAGHEAQMDAYTNHDVLLGMPTVTVLGNHDADSYAIYDQHFNHPNMLINPETGTYYGATYTAQPEKYLQSADYYFTYNNVLFLVLNTNTYYASVDNSAEHLAFIDRVLAETANQDFNWTIALYHQSPYGSSYHQDPDREEAEAYAKMRSVLVPKLYEAGVDMILSGHDHCYTRTYVLKPGTDNGAYNDSYVIQNPEATDAFSNADGILHVTAATSSASQVNADKYNTEAYKVITDTANTRHMTRIEITENTLTLITYNLGTQLSNNITEVDRFVLTSNADATVEAAITAIGDVTLEDEAAIKAAREAYEALSPQLKKRVSNLDVLVAAEEALAQAKQEAVDKEIADKAAAAAVDALIDAIGTVTLDSLDAIVAAEEAYNNLTEDQKDLVENHLILTDARAAYDTLKAAADKEAADKAAAAEVDALIIALPAENELKLTDKAQVEAARVAYAALNADEARYVTKLDVLEAAEAKIAQLQAAADKEAADRAAAAEVDALIIALPAKNELKLTDKAQVEAARAAYAALNADEARYVTKLAVLEAAEAKIAQLQAAADKLAQDKAAAKAVDDQITAIGTVTYSKAAAIATVRNAYDALTPDQKDLVENLNTLTAAEAEIAQLQAQIDAVETKIAAIGEVTLSDAEAIAQAKAAFDALAADQQLAVENAAALTAAETALKALQDAVAEVIAKIDAIGTVTLESKADIDAAEAAYTALNAEQKALVTNYNVLTAAKEAYEELKAVADQAEIDQAAANGVKDLINAIGTVTLNSRSAIEAAEAAYAALTDAQKDLVTNYATLTAARAEYDRLVAEKEAADKAAADAVIAKIAAIGTVTLNSKTAIEDAEAAYAALTDTQKALVTNHDTLLAARAAYDQLVAEKEAADNKAAADAVIAKISAIGTVTLESKTAIEDAEAAYAALTDTQKALVTNYSALTAARAAYDQQAAEKEAADKAAADKAAADAAIAKIEAIGTVTLESKLAIEAARVAYNALTPEQKAMVSAQILLKLTNAETALKALETPEEPPKTGDTTMIAPVMLLLGLSVAGLAVVLTGKKRFF